MIPRFGEPIRSDVKYRLRPGAYAVLPRGGAVLLTAQLGDDLDIQLPGGGIEFGESTLQGLHREVLEETGWRIAGPKRLGSFRRFVYMPEYRLWAEKLCHVYVAKPVLPIARPVETDHRTLWASATHAAQLLGNEGDRFFLRRYFEGPAYSKRMPEMSSGKP